MPTIDRTTLIKIARDTATQRLAARPSLISAYVIGSVAANEPLLGEATDIDLVLIDTEPPPVAREVVRLSDQVALDIHHHAKSDYANPKTLRVHPWRGPAMCEPLFIQDPTHFFELAQASARGQFHRADFVAARARAFVDLARQTLHVNVLPGAEPEAPVTYRTLCEALLNAANAAISLTGFPGAGRRLTLKLEAAARKLGRADVYDDFLALLGGAQFDRVLAENLLTHWNAAYQAGQHPGDELIHPARRTLYERGFRAQLQADRAPDIVWLLLYTWQALMHHVPTDSAHGEAWVDFLELLHLADADEFHARVAQVRAYVATAAELVEQWAEENGA